MKTNSKLRLLGAGIALCMALVLLNSCLNNDDDFFDSQAQFQADLRLIDDYLDERGIVHLQDDVTQIRYVVQNPGDGMQQFVFADSLTLSYEARVLETGVVFESASNEKVRTLSLLVAIRAASALIREGGSVTAYIPSAYGFTNQGSDEVPPNAVLQVDLQLDQVHDQTLEAQMQVIKDTLVNRGDTIGLELHPTGIYFIQEEGGSGRFPRYNENVTVNFEGRLLGSSNAFDQADGASFFVTNGNATVAGLIPGWVVMLRDMRVGEQRTIYLPSTYAYGENGRSPSIPSNANLEFDIELISINN
ncbi:MAG: FKBP-type peptidyl-prolyl cis-trans isomerase [Cytophagales bacterium]|nr:FKBP-type peptidyl-prolyl cis-trans isomerase [Cytophagales bacterium]